MFHRFYLFLILDFSFQGRLQNGQDITITQYSDTSVYARVYEDCMNEASILVKFVHENMIELLGYCIGGTKVYLVYDLAPKATLAGLMFDPTCNLLDWNKRCKIILGVARVLAYLHNHAPIRIIHRDVKPANILLDESFDPKLSCFGTALATNETCPIQVDRLCGTPGYMAPEYLSASMVSTKADVYSFGALVLGTVTGQRQLDLTRDEDPILSDMASVIRFCDGTLVRKNWLEGTLSNIVDPRIEVDSTFIAKFIEIGLLCVEKAPGVRPTMEEVVDMLLGTSTSTIHVSDMRARMNLSCHLDLDLDWECESDLGSDDFEDNE
ncbi:putative protein kinase RLK-Pelle-DLSV family [Helianthus annuus]|nr:putative protein kinase RLK-Pelle-DLSV family [Helianthus annuus]KAJ0531159.1 putative protein kinase RLK-Pelle-DLSV family [Helianthus annuus]